jgi:hypothetical protein
MRIRDLQWRTVPVWPPEWFISDEGAGEQGVLDDVQLRDDLTPRLITISVTHHNSKMKGIIVLDDPAHLEVLYDKLKDNIGRSITEIGDMSIELIFQDI